MILQKYFVFGWVFARTFIIMFLPKYIDRRGGGWLYRNLVSETM